MLMLISVLFPVFSGLALLLSKTEVRKTREYWVIGTAVVTAALAITAVLTGYGEKLVMVRFTQTIALTFAADGLGSIFAVMVSVLWIIASFYALEYMKHEGAETRFFAFFLASFGVTLGVAFSANIVTMYLFYELLTLATLPLVMHAMNGRARYAGKTYILYSMTGAGLGFVAMMFLLYYGAGDFVLGGNLDMAALAGDENVMLLFFVLGFLIYAFMFGAVGSTASKLEDINTSVMPLTMLFVVAFVVVMTSMSSGNVDNIVMKVCSFIPFTSPMSMFTRIAMSTVPWYEIVISIVILIASTIGIGVLAAKIYRVGVLLYGTPPKIGAIIKAVMAADRKNN